MKEEILLEIKVPKPQGEQEIDNLTNKPGALNDENKELLDQNKQLEKSGQKNSQQYIENAKHIEINKQKIQENTSSRKGLISAITAEDNSIKGLKVRNAELIRQRDQINSSTEAGRAKIKAINAEINKNNDAIKNNVSGLEKQKINIGNYASALDRVVPGLSGYVAQVQTATAVTLTWSAALLSLPLIAIGVALASIIAYFTSTEEGLDAVERAAAKWKAGLDVLKDRLSDVGKSIVDTFNGESNQSALGKSLKGIADVTGLTLGWAAAKKLLEAAFPGVTEEIEKETEAAGRLADILDKVEEQENDLILLRAAAGSEFRRLRLLAEDSNKPLSERIGLLQRAIVLEQDITQKELQVQRQRAAASLGKEFISDDDLDRIRNYGIALEEVGLSKSTEDDRKKAIEEFAKLFEIQEKSFALQLSAQTRINGLRKQLNKEASADTNERLKAIEDNYVLELELADINIGPEGLITQVYRNFNQRIIDDTKRRNEETLASDQAAATAEKEIQAARAKNLQSFGNVLSTLAGKSKALAIAGIVVQKVGAIAEIFANLGIANIKAVAASPLTFGQPWVGINSSAAGFSIAGIIAQAAQSISEIGGFAGGGVTGTRINKSHGRSINRSNGDDVLITAKSGEVILNEKHQRALGGDATFAAIGVPGFAASGAIDGQTRIAANQARQALDVNQLAGLVNNVRTVLVLENFEAKKASRDSLLNTAQVI